jgi:GntR family transcriptional regulator/MocR family aminotransferase
VELYLDPSLKRGVSAALFAQIRDAIVSARVAPGDRMPPTRQVADQLGISRHTVTTVYGRLVAEGYLEGKAGGGTVVADTTGALDGPRTGRARRAPQPSALRPAREVAPDEPGAPAPPAGGFDLRIGRPDPALFPVQRWRQSVAASLHAPPEGDGEPAGLPALRRSLARWVGRSRGVETTAAQLMVTSGAQQALDLVARVALRPGDRIAVEEPGYIPARRLFQALGLQIVPVPVDRDGLVVEAIPARVKAVYTTPSHQSPTGAALTLPRRRALLAFADRHDAVVVEDDYDSEFRHSDRPLEPLHRLDASGRVIYVGTFSKTLAPALRLAFVVWPEALAGAATAWRSLMDGRPPGITQHAMHRFITDGFLDAHLRRVRKVYRERHAVVVDWIAACAGEGLLVAGPTSHSGLHVTAGLPDGVTEDEVRAEAYRRDIALTHFGPCCLTPPERDNLLLGYGLTPVDRLPDALTALAGVLADIRDHTGHGPRRRPRAGAAGRRGGQNAGSSHHG